MKSLNKKADGGLTLIVVVVLILIFIGWLVNLGNRECRGNSDCGDDSYCGSDFSCHKIPVIEKSTTIVNYDLKWPAFILGFAIVIAAIIYKWDKIKIMPKKEERKADYTYYTSYNQ